MACMFEKLEVYQKAVDFADEVSALINGTVIPANAGIQRGPGT